MQAYITPQEQAQLKMLTAPKGRTKWFLEETKMSRTPLEKMRKLRQADKEMVDKARAFLKRKDVRALIEQMNAAVA